MPDTDDAGAPAGRVVLVGGGNMGGALLKGWLDAGMEAAAVVVVDPAPSPAVSDLVAIRGVGRHDDARSLDGAEIVVLAVKPQAIDAIAPSLHALAARGACFVSVMAGVTLQRLEALLRTDRVIRAMPNTPALVARGITGVCAGRGVSEAHIARVDRLLAAVGAVEWLEDESLIDAVTGVSGSGPAYVFLLAETLAAAGEKAGLPAPLAARLARATVAGAGALLDASSEEAATLRRNVTSPNGTTAAALAILMGERGLGPLMDDAVAAASRRSRELGG